MAKELIWLDAPLPKAEGGRRTTMHQLAARPGKWAVVGKYATRSSAAVTAQRLQNRSKDQFGRRRVRATVRKIETGDGRPFVVQAVWMGDAL